MNIIKKYFISSILSAIIGLILAAVIGFEYGGSPTAILNALFITAILAILEISLSFDNAIVNAVVLEKMTPLWRHRFLTWGMLIAVFGMRLIFPLLIVTLFAGISPWAALKMAAFDPQQYAIIMLQSHLEVAAFGGAFLMMVALKYFYDENKEEHWIQWIEVPASYLGKVEAIEIGITLCFLIGISKSLEDAEQMRFLLSGLAGLITFIAVDGIGSWLEMSEDAIHDIQKASAGMFIYLEVLDASFSFDGVVGAFAITNNLFIIMIGLSVGAFFVRSLTIYFVEEKTLSKYAYLEHGAFYAIGMLATMMLFDVFLHIPEWVTGLVGAVFILASFYWSLRFPTNLQNSSKDN